MLGELAKKLAGETMFQEFRRHGPEPISTAVFNFNVAQQDEELLPWIFNAKERAGDFLKSLCEAALRADADNYGIIRPALLHMKNRFPKYIDWPNKSV